jgi:hypothetical protein
MSKRILVSESEKNSILNMHESYKNYGFIMEDDVTSKPCERTSDVSTTVRLVDGKVTVNGNVAKAGMQIKKGDKLSFIGNEAAIYSEEFGAGDSGAGGSQYILKCSGTETEHGD